MATKQTEPQNEGLATVGNQSLEAPPDYFQKNDRRGFEDTQQSDVLIPRLALAQALSPQVTDGDPNRIEGLTVGDLFNSVTKQNYGREVHVQLLRKMPLRAMEFNSIDDGGGVKDPDVPLNDPRCQWSGDEKPVATVFRDFIAVLLDANGQPANREVIALSFKSSGIKVAKALWGLAMMRDKPVFAGRYQITTGVELKPKPHQVYKVQNAGWVSKKDAVLGEQMFEAVQKLDATKIHREVVDDPDDFVPARYEVQPSTEM
jgi:hypothetical protein